MLGILYVSYDGILEPLGQSQVLSYLEKISGNRAIYLISFEKEQDRSNQHLCNQIIGRINKSNIHWYPMTYHKKFTTIATLWDIFRGIVLGFWIVIRYKLGVVHARSYVASVIALVLKKMLRVYFIFDMRGFWADERVDGDIWKKDSNLYRIAKYFEKLFLLNADVIISLTYSAVKEIEKFQYLQHKTLSIEVITTCTNLELFKPNFSVKKANDKEESFTVGYVGSVGVWYLFSEALDYFKLIKKVIPNARLHIINKGSHEYIYKYLSNAGINENSVLVEEKDHAGVVRAMQSMDVGIFMIKPLYSKMASMPTKLGEFLGCGVPCICNSGVGDMSQIVDGEHVGVVLKSFNQDEKKESIDCLLELINNPETKKRCRKTALKYFSLEQGIQQYESIYCSLD
jgi:glycosyltransferase involved in cell wall biosynthesis